MGGVGHTTDTLRMKINEEFPSIETKELPEAKIFRNYLDYKYGLDVDYMMIRVKRKMYIL